MLSPQQQALLNDLIGILYPFLDNGDITSTTLAEFKAAVDSYPVVNWAPTSNGFGIPAVGMGMEVKQSPEAVASTSVLEAMAVLSNEFGYEYDQYGYGVGQMDLLPSRSAVLYSQTAPPIPASGLPGPSVIYDEFETPLWIRPTLVGVFDQVVSTGALVLPFSAEVIKAQPNNTAEFVVQTNNLVHVTSSGRLHLAGFKNNTARTIELSFSGNLAATPQVYVWFPNHPAPAVVPVVERVNSRTFRFSIPGSTELKVIVL